MPASKVPRRSAPATANDGGAWVGRQHSSCSGRSNPDTAQPVKAYLDFHPTPKFSADLVFDRGTFLRPRQRNNLDKPDGVYYLGRVFTRLRRTNIGAHYQVVKHLRFFVQIDNIFNHRYYTAGQLNSTPFDNAGNFIPRPFASNTDAVRNSTFFSPGAPRGAFGGMKITF